MLETKASILCALCGIKFIPTMGSICQTCTIKSFQEQKLLQGHEINYCRYCERYERPPWINCDRQSQQMLTLLLKKIKGLNKVQVQSASFVWTQPHSKRFKLKVIFNREVSDNMKLEVTEIVEFVQKYTQCNDCRKKFTPHDWVASVQLRQQVGHKKTILNFQQILLKQKMLDKIIKTQEVEGGVDIFFSHQNDANRFVEFLKGRSPLAVKKSQKLISHNQRDNTSNVKITYSCTIPKICKDDLIRIPRKLSKQLGSCCQVLLCTKISSYLHFLDVSNFKKIQISTTQYFLYQKQIEIFSIKTWGKKFIVLDCQTKQPQTHNKFSTFGLTFMKQDEYVQLYTRCHFSDQPDNELIGFELTQIENIDGVKGLPDYLMVQKVKDKELKRKLKQKKRKKQAQQRKKQRQSQVASKLAQRPQISSDEDESDQWQDMQQPLLGKIEQNIKKQNVQNRSLVENQKQKLQQNAKLGQKLQNS